MISTDMKRLIGPLGGRVTRKQYDHKGIRRIGAEIERLNECLEMDMQQPLISVIVPIYNVEKYVRKCLDSLVNQTMKQIEVICIDDGSTDGSGKITDEYESNEFPIFRVIHTENRGLSAARNRGIDEARAEWIMFVDSDDWVESGFCEIPYKAAVEYGADLVIFDRYWINKNGKIIKTNETVAPYGIVEEKVAHEYGGIAVWNKLYRATLFGEIRYPEGRVCEDVAITHKIVYLAKTSVRIRERLYYHIYRKESISESHSEELAKDSFVSNLERYTDLKEWGYQEEKLMQNLCSAALGYLAYTPYRKDLLHKKAEEIIESADGFPKTYSVIKRTALKIWRFDKRLFYIGGRVIAIVRR